MPLVTLTTDMGIKDHYVGAVKGSILSICPEATIIDISHKIQPFNLRHAAFVLQNAWLHFPPKTVHVVSVGGSAQADKPYIALEYQGHYFIGSDNGLFSLALEDAPVSAVVLDIDPNSCHTFPERSILAPAAAHLAKNGDMAELGPPREKLRRQMQVMPVSGPDFIRGHVIYIDAYGNAICNITRSLFESVANGRSYSIFLSGRRYKISRISRTYTDKAEGEIVAVFNEGGYLEIAINNGAEGSGGGAAGLVGLQEEQAIGIEFRNGDAEK